IYHAGLDIYLYKKGKKSSLQITRNLISYGTTTIGGAAGASIGSVTGSFILPFAGTLIGGIVGGIVGGYYTNKATNAALDQMIKSDDYVFETFIKEYLIPIFESELEENLITNEEHEKIVENLQNFINKKMVDISKIRKSFSSIKGKFEKDIQSYAKEII